MKKLMHAAFMAFAVAAVAAMPPGAYAADELPLNPTVAELLRYAYQHSPEVSVVKEDWRAKIENIRVKGGYPDPELMIEQQGFSEPMWALRLSAMIPYPGKVEREALMAKGEADIAKVEVDRLVRDLSVMVRESAAEIAYMQAALDIASKNSALLARINQVIDNAYTANRSELIDVVKARAQVSQVRFDAELISELLNVEKARLNNRIGRDAQAPLGNIRMEEVGALSLTVAEVEALALAKAEELKTADLEVELSKTAKEAAQLEAYPDFTIGAFKDPIDGDVESYGFSIGLTVPLWEGKNRGRVALADAAIRKAQAMKTARAKELSSEVRELYFRTQNARRLYDLYTTNLIPQAAKSLELAETWMKAGQAGYTDYVEVASTLYGFELAVARAQADHAKYLARLEKFAGQKLSGAGEAGK